MECVYCQEASFNRIVVNPTTGKEHGGLCEECEVSEFGLLSTEPLWRQDSGCALCPSDADVALPEIDCLVEWDDGTVDADYQIDNTTLTLCTHHVSQVLDIEAPAPAQPLKTRA